MVISRLIGKFGTFSEANRGQAFTLEAVISSLIVLTALLFALQSTVVTPNTTGGIDTATRETLADQAQDILDGTATRPTENLSYYVRYWNDSSAERTFARASRPEVGYGDEKPPAEFGDQLNDTFTAEGYAYNVILTYQRPNSQDIGEMVMVYQGTPNRDAVSAVYPVTLFDSDTLTGPASTDKPIENVSSQIYPIKDVATRSPIYNVVEVRITVW